MDIFSLGCLQYHVLTGDQHPFGQTTFKRQKNILGNTFTLAESLMKDDTSPDSIPVIRLMIDHNPARRPSIKHVYNFYNPKDNRCNNYFLTIILPKFNSLVYEEPQEGITPARFIFTNRLCLKNIFNSVDSDIFVFTGIQYHQLKMLTRAKVTDSSRKQVLRKEISARYIRLEQVGDWKRLCEKTTKPIHIVHCDFGKKIVSRISSKNEVTGLLEIFQSPANFHGSQSEDELINEIEKPGPFTPNQIVCISCPPEMDEVKVLTSLANRLNGQDSTKHIPIFIPAAEWIRELQRCMISDEADLFQAILKSVLNRACRDEMTEQLLYS